MTAETSPRATAWRGAQPEHLDLAAASGADSPSIMSMVVVLPAPFGPRKATISPWRELEVDAPDGLDAPKVLVTPGQPDGGHRTSRGGGWGRAGLRGQFDRSCVQRGRRRRPVPRPSVTPSG